MGSDPIVYIDGVRMMTGGFPVQAAKDQGNRAANVTQSPLDLINPNDIERVEVIKGSAATTLYGTEASAGVIQIFTKRGSTGRPVWTIETQQGTAWSQRMGVGEFENQYGASSYYLYMDPWICTGFLKCGQFANTTHTQQYSTSVRGGGTALQYFTSAEFFDDVGNTPNDGLNRWTARGNFTYSPVEDLQLQWNTAFVKTTQTNSPQGNNAEGLELNVFRQNQNYFANNDTALINRVFEWHLGSEIERYTTGGTATYSPIADLTNRMTVGYDFSSQESRNIRPFGFFAHPEGIIHVSEYQRRILTFDYVGSYKFDLLSDLITTISWGGQTVGDERRQVEGYGVGFPGAAEPTINSAAQKTGYEERQRLWNAGFFFQNILDIKNRYFITLGLRVDGNSAFGSGFGLQTYPKFSGAWVVSDESFWNPSWGTIKLRSAFGKSGRAPGAFDAVRTWENTPLVGQPAFTPQNVGNPDLGPEVTSEIELGFDASWIDDRIRATYTYYTQTTQDALLELDQIPSLGFTNTQLTNVGEIDNWGHELSLEFAPISTANYGWDFTIGASTNESKILSHPVVENVGRPISWSNHVTIRHPDAIPVNATGTPNFILLTCTIQGADGTQVPNTAVADGAPCRETNVFRGSNLPTKFLNLATSVRLPYGVTVSTRGEFRGGHYTTGINPIAIGRSVRSTACFPYYANDNNVALKPDTPALWVARCTPSYGTGYSAKADYFKLRTVSATVPVDFAFPDRVQNAVLTLSLNNFYTWAGESLWGTFGIENFGNDGISSEQSGISSNERISAPTSFRASLRVTF